MKKLNGIFSIVLVLSMLMALLPTGIAFAAKDPGSVVVEIHNATGGEIVMNMVNPNGSHAIFHFPVGVSEITVGVGWHAYAANTKCGLRTDNVNVNVGKEFYFSCGNASVGTSNIAQGVDNASPAGAPVCDDDECCAPVHPFGASIFGGGGFGGGNDCWPWHHHHHGHGWW